MEASSSSSVSISSDENCMYERRSYLTAKYKALSEEIRDLASPQTGWVILRGKKAKQREDISVARVVNKQTLDTNRRRAYTSGSYEDLVNFSANVDGKVTVPRSREKVSEVRRDQIDSESSYSSIELYRILALSKPMFAKIRDSRGNLPIHNAVNHPEPNLMIVCELIRTYPIGEEII